MHETDDFPISTTGPRLGIIGGGQLARMTAMSALQLGCNVVVLERNAYSPAATLANHSMVGDWNRMEPLLELAAQVDVVTLENEFVDAGLLDLLEREGHVVFPSSRTLALVQDKLEQKRVFGRAGLPVPRARAVLNPEELALAVADFGMPSMLKARRNAYDGKGNAAIRTGADLDSAWKRLGGDCGNPLYLEEFCDFTAELAVIVTRGKHGECAIYPVVETVQRDHVCHLVTAPAQLDDDTRRRAGELARLAVESVDGVGSFGVEMFLTANGEILINEIAPRVHNSGHYTLEACECSQFENHVRAVLGLPLGSARMTAPAAAMVNLLGSGHGSGVAAGLNGALAVPGAHIHLYGKARCSPGRKMGHVTSLGATVREATESALQSAANIRFGEIS